MGKFRQKCHECGAQCDVIFGDQCRGVELSWYQSLFCKKCGMSIESGGMGKLPNELRDMELSQEGEWTISISSGSKVIIGAVLRKALNFTISETNVILKSIPGTILLGTHSEMEQIKYLLKIDGIKSSISA
jgi:hypothetical protein